MNITFDNFSIVILAQTHNPSILNPDFLKMQGIINPDYTPISFICTPPVSQLSFKEGISIIAEFEKLQFIDTDSGRIPGGSPVPEIAMKYINKLPFVQYTAVGINFNGHVAFENRDDAARVLPERFLKDGVWSTFEKSFPYIGLKFNYAFDDINCLISMDTLDAILPDQTVKPIISMSGNYHKNEKTLSVITEHIQSWGALFSHFTRFIDENFKEGQ